MTHNPNVSYLYKKAIKSYDLEISSTGALLAYSGKYTGRCPQYKRVYTNDNIWWGDINIKICENGIKSAKQQINKYLEETKNEIFIIDAYAGWDENYRIKIRFYCIDPYHAQFINNMFIISQEKFENPDVYVYNLGKYKYVSNKYYSNETLVALDLVNDEIFILGTEYAGEIKKSILTLMMYKMPLKNCLPLHSSCNIGKKDDITLFFGLSGTGKTSLSSEPNRKLIGDDEHVWTPEGIFNVEGGCYAKCINLSQQDEPDIFNAIKYGSVLENVGLNAHNVVDFKDDSITKNTRVSFSLNNIDNVAIPALSKHHPKNIILLTCDAFGVLPPVSKLNLEQAILFFVKGYTSKIAGTEQGIKEPVATFSPCFGGAFLVHKPERYGELLREYILKYSPNIWLVNTGWINGKYGKGERISIKYSRSIIDNIHNNSLLDEEYSKLKYFNLDVPKHCIGVPENILMPEWKNKDLYDKQLKKLYKLFYD